MEELMTPNFRVVLSIKEGRGFEQITLPTMILATLNGHSLETEAIEPGSNPQYAHDLVWEVDKSRLRKMKTGHTPLKLECFALKGNETKEKIGYFLLSIRSAQTVTTNTEINIKEYWHRLLGLKSDFKTHKPELLVALSIQEQELKKSNMPSELKNPEDHSQTSLNVNKIVPILLHDERLIQLGPLNTCHDLFLLSITAVSAANLDTLLQKELSLNAKENLNFCCQILENDVHFSALKKDCGEFWMLNEKVVLRIRSSLKTFKEYLRVTSQLFIYLRYKDATIGQSEVNLQPLIPTDDINEFHSITENSTITLEKRCFLHNKNFSQKNKPQNQRPYLDVQLKLQHVGIKSDSTNEIANTVIHPRSDIISSENHNFNKDLTNIFEKTNLSEIDYHRNPGGDFGRYNKETYIINYPSDSQIRNKHSSSCEVIRNQPTKALCSQSADTILCQCNKKDCTKNVETYHCYCLNVFLTAIKLSSPKLTTPNIEIRFHHPKSEIMSTFHPKFPLLLDEKQKLDDMGCKLHFISAVDEIKHLLLSFPPKISIYDIGGSTKTCISQSVLDVKQLFHHNKSVYQCDLPFYDTEQNQIGNMDIKLSLEDHGPYYRAKRAATSENLGPPILDDSLAYKIVDELETWKERQKEIFKVELKRKEERHLNLLSGEWQKQRENLELKLACSVEQCKMLATSLNNATDDLRTRRLKSLEKEARLMKANEELQWKYEEKVQELKESYRVMQEELMSKVNGLEKRKIMLESQVEPLTIDNERLRLLVTKQSEDLEGLHKGSLTQDQTASLLQELKTLEEKLHIAQESKSFFKEQWGKAVREIHRMKTEHQQAIQVQIKNSKEELQNLDLEDILCADSSALSNDQILLGQIQQEIDVIKPKPLFIEKDSYNQVFAPVTNKIPKNHKSFSKIAEEYDGRLQALTEERDSLLKTGSYTIDDAVIVKLNTEIRSLMMR